MQAPRLDDVMKRVVAWHNRHPLARRIQASQVHSIGEVVLPFVSARAPARSASEPAPPLAAQAAPPSPASLAAVVLARAAARPTTPAWAQPPAPGGGPDDPADIDLSATHATAPHDRQLAAAPQASEEPPVRPAADRDGTASGPAAAGWLACLRQRLAGGRRALPRLEAAFSRDFLWPLTPQAVARWAQRHGRLQPLAPPDWPRRRVAPDPARQSPLRQKGLVHAVELHLLTAAIGVDDRRLRLLIGGDGQVIGPRAYSRPRLALAMALGLSAMLAAAAPWWLPPMSDTAGPGVATAAATATPAAAPATVAAASGIGGAAPEAPAEPARAAEPVAAPAAEPAIEHTTEPATKATSDIRPQLSADERQAARQQAEQLRGQAASPLPTPGAEAAPAATGPVYAVVSRPSRQREAATDAAVLMQAAGERLPPPAPAHVELMQTGSEWRAAWWPFTSLVDAERARVMLVGRGLKAEVVEF